MMNATAPKAHVRAPLQGGHGDLSPAVAIESAVTLFEHGQWAQSNALLLGLPAAVHENSFVCFCIARNFLHLLQDAEAEAWFTRSLATPDPFMWAAYEAARLQFKRANHIRACELVLEFLCAPAPTSSPRGARFVFSKRPTADELRAVRTPTLVLLAGRGRQHHNDRVAVIAKERLPDVEVRELPASHHTIPFEGADDLNRELTTFLA